jgi:hypothetical protein
MFAQPSEISFCTLVKAQHTCFQTSPARPEAQRELWFAFTKFERLLLMKDWGNDRRTL